MGLRAFALSALPEEPWRNGGGRTRTIATGMREPPTLAVDSDSEPPWDWRISVATIERSGPFSAFPGVDRSSLLLGAGSIELSATGEANLHMQHPGDTVAYRGDPVWLAEVRRDGPPLSLLNVMTRRGAAKARMKAVHDDSSLTAHALAVLVIDGCWEIVNTLTQANPDQGLTLADGQGALSEWSTSLSRSTASWRVERMSPTGLLVVIEMGAAEPFDACCSTE